MKETAVERLGLRFTQCLLTRAECAELVLGRISVTKLKI